MNLIRKRRLYWLIFLVLVVSLATGLIFYALQKNINLFFTPSELLAQNIPANYHCRLGGMVKQHSVQREKNTLTVRFIVTDNKRELPVLYTGILPDLFREGSGMVAEGYWSAQGIFVANQVLAKHDENYMPKAIYKAMRNKYISSGVPLNKGW